MNFIVVAQSEVIGAYATVNEAKQKLLEFPSAARTPSRLIAEVKDGIVQSDPHVVDGQRQGDGVRAGFNKWWWNWNDIKRMLKIAQAYVTNNLVERHYLVVADHEVVSWHMDLKAAKATLAEYPKGASSPSRLIAEVKNGSVVSDPHNVNGENQGGGVKAGFNKWWENWDDINRMIEIAQVYEQKYPGGGPAVRNSFFLVVAGDVVVGRFKEVEAARVKLNEYPSGVPPPSRLVLEVRDGIVMPDPHTVGGQRQGDGVAGGFNKWWADWNDIKRMVKVAEAYVARYPDPWDVFFVVVVGSEVVRKYIDLEKAKKKLNDYPKESSDPSRLIAEVWSGIVQTDPHIISGQDQGNGIHAGFNKYWKNWDDITRMLKIAQAHVDGSAPIHTPANVGKTTNYGTIETIEAGREIDMDQSGNWFQRAMRAISCKVIWFVIAAIVLVVILLLIF